MSKKFSPFVVPAYSSSCSLAIVTSLLLVLGDDHLACCKQTVLGKHMCCTALPMT